MERKTKILIVGSGSSSLLLLQAIAAIGKEVIVVDDERSIKKEVEQMVLSLPEQLKEYPVEPLKKREKPWKQKAYFGGSNRGVKR